MKKILFIVTSLFIIGFVEAKDEKRHEEHPIMHPIAFPSGPDLENVIPNELYCCPRCRELFYQDAPIVRPTRKNHKHESENDAPIIRPVRKIKK